LLRVLVGESERVRPDGGHPANSPKVLENACFLHNSVRQNVRL
jgi:hypothetical protein